MVSTPMRQCSDCKKYLDISCFDGGKVCSSCQKNNDRKERSHCEHNRKRYSCAICKGKGICEHNRSKHKCLDCKGISTCEHGKQKYLCKECRGTGICSHNRERYYCRRCGGGAFCEHNKYKRSCKICKELKNLNAMAAQEEISNEEASVREDFFFCCHGISKAFFCFECSPTVIESFIFDCEHGISRILCDTCMLK